MQLEELGRRLRARRLELGLTLAQVAERAELSLPYIANLERGRGNPTVSVVSRVADALGLPLSTLWGQAAEEVGSGDEVTLFPEMPASLRTFSRTKQFADAIAQLAEAAGVEPGEMRQRVLTSMATAPRRSRREPTAEDWRRLLDAFRLIVST